MPRLNWDNTGERLYETGVDRGVLYVGDQPGVSWTGLTAVEENPSGGSPRPYYLDGVKYLNIPSAEEFEGTISAFTYPQEFAVCEGITPFHAGLLVTQQIRKSFGLSYRTRVGNDLSGTDHAYKIHIVYNALAAPSQRTFNSVGDSEELADFSWAITTRAPVASGYRRSAHVIVDTRYTNPNTVSAVEDILYGSDIGPSRIPGLLELLDVFETHSTVIVTDNGDGTFTVSGPDNIVQMIDSDTFQIDWASAIYIDVDSYTLSSL